MANLVSDSRRVYREFPFMNNSGGTNGHVRICMVCMRKGTLVRPFPSS